MKQSISFIPGYTLPWEKFRRTAVSSMQNSKFLYAKVQCVNMNKWIEGHTKMEGWQQI
jgi:hypothetical protein